MSGSVPVSQGEHGGGRSEDGRVTVAGACSRSGPSGEGEALPSVIGEQVAVPVRSRDDGASGQVGVGGVPELAVVSSIDAAPAGVSFLMQALIELAGEDGSWSAATDGERIA